ncbi:MAG: AraC family transcriptional regulator [Sphingobacterium sp.]|nr:AraC family transcriptional regulator [Sphingobacterium sp.]
MSHQLQYQFRKPNPDLEDFVYAFSCLSNVSKIDKGIIIPNGRVDLVWCKVPNQQWEVLLMGLETQAKEMPQNNIQAFFSISFNPIALEYILRESIADVLNGAKKMPANFWSFEMDEIIDFDTFCTKASAKIKTLIPAKIDERKRQLFRIIFEKDGNINVSELSEKIVWSERQINRYFNQTLGISLKTYCIILRFQASLPYIQKGQLAPQFDNFTDQSHFIKEIKKLSGVSPKELSKNENDRFLQFLVYTVK